MVLLCLKHQFFTLGKSELSSSATNIYNINEMKNGEIIQTLLQIFVPVKSHTIFNKLHHTDT